MTKQELQNVLLELLRQFESDVIRHNRFTTSPLEDEVEVTLKNFIKWLEWEEL